MGPLPQRPQSYQPTYEELKPDFQQHLFRLCQSYQPTYEELKHCRAPFEDGEKMSYQPTYEELKLRKSLSSILIGIQLPAYL